MGMSGVGKTTLGSQLPMDQWFHYSGDYRIGTRYLGEQILDNIKMHAMKEPFLRDLIMSDSIYFGSNISFHHLKPVSTFLGKIGNPELGGISKDEFMRRQKLHHQAEVRAMRDVGVFIEKARRIYDYPHFLNDTGGSVCELTDEEAWHDLAERSLVIYLKADEEMENLLIERAKADPKPLYYDKQFLSDHLETFLSLKGLSHSDEINPDEFVPWVFPALIQHRRPLYQGIADRHGYTVDAKKVMDVRSEQDVLDLISSVL